MKSRKEDCNKHRICLATELAGAAVLLFGGDGSCRVLFVLVASAPTDEAGGVGARAVDTIENASAGLYRIHK